MNVSCRGNFHAVIPHSLKRRMASAEERKKKTTKTLKTGEKKPKMRHGGGSWEGWGGGVVRLFWHMALTRRTPFTLHSNSKSSSIRIPRPCYLAATGRVGGGAGILCFGYGET